MSCGDQIDFRIITLYDRFGSTGLVRWVRYKMNLTVVAIALLTLDRAGSQGQVSTITNGRSIQMHLKTSCPFDEYESLLNWAFCSRAMDYL